MAGQVVEAKSLASWEDAFKDYHIPTIRRLEQQLRRNIDDNREKLRSLVGASYRDLLGTAERIIEMNAQMNETEAKLSVVGRKCNARAVERSVENQERMRKMRVGQWQGQVGLGRQGRLAQTKVLQNALTAAGRVIKGASGGGNALLASKLLLLARLLHKAVSDEGDAPEVLESLGRKARGLRRKLLSHIDKTLCRSSVDREARVSTLCAYAMVTTSAPKEVLRHFLQVRFEQIEAAGEAAKEDDILDVLDMYSQTIVDARELFPRRFADALSGLEKVPLLKDKQIASASELSLDVYEQWLADQVRAFTPWVRHDHLTSTDVADGLASWSKQAESCLLEGLKQHLDTQTEASRVLNTRSRMLARYLELRIKVRSGWHVRLLGGLRSTFRSRLEQLAEECVKPDRVLESIQGTAGGLSKPVSLWSIAMHETDLSSGAASLRQAILQQRRCRTDDLDLQIGQLEKWLQRVKRFWAVTVEMRSQKWEDDMDLEVDDDDGGDDESLQQLLSVRDSDTLRERQSDSASSAVQAMYDELKRAKDTGAEPALLLRLAREVNNVKREAGHLFGRPIGVDADAGWVAQLQRHVGERVVDTPAQTYAKRFGAATVTPVTLWDGTPALPVQPSPATFGLLKTVHQAMCDVGNDMWSPDAVALLKGALAGKLAEELSSVACTVPEGPDAVANGHLNGDAAEGAESGRHHDRPEQREEQLKQRLFDLYYLQRVLGRPTAHDSNTGITDLVAQVKDASGVDSAADERVAKSASDYWRRTCLLFGLLSPNDGD